MVRQGNCPKCDTELEYHGSELADESYIYSVTCPKCGFSGTEQYSLVFWGFVGDDYKEYVA